MAKPATASTEPTSTGTSSPVSESNPPSTSGKPPSGNGKAASSKKSARKPSPFLRALRRAELLIEDLPREMAIKVAEHALFIARGLKTESGDQCDGRIPFNELANG